MWIFFFRNLSHATITVSSVIAINSLNELHTPCGVVSPQLGLLFLFIYLFLEKSGLKLFVWERMIKEGYIQHQEVSTNAMSLIYHWNT